MFCVLYGTVRKNLEHSLFEFMIYEIMIYELGST